MTEYRLIDSSEKLNELTDFFLSNSVNALAMDFEEESNLHIYGEHLCLIQLFDGSMFYIIDVLAVITHDDGVDALKNFLESPIQKIMFDCSSDAAIVRKTMKIQLRNVYDLRVIAKALEFNGNLNALIERNLEIKAEDYSLKKKYQCANWMKRPLSEEQKEYALGDVRYLFDLKASLEAEVKVLPVQVQNQIQNAMRTCANQKHKDRPGWEKICNYRTLSKRQKTFLRYFFNARDALARKANVPPTNIVEKQILVAMAKEENWEPFLEGVKLRYSKVFEEARLNAEMELKTK